MVPLNGGIAVVMPPLRMVSEEVTVELDAGAEVTAVDEDVAVVLSEFGFAGEVATERAEILADPDEVDDEIVVVLA